MQYLKKITDYKTPTKRDKLAYNTLWVCPYQNGFLEVFIQKNKDKNKPKWELLGYEIQQGMEQFWNETHI